MKGSKKKDKQMTSQKQLVTQLRDLARDREHQMALMANKECLRSLEQTLNSSDPEVVLITLDTLYICSLTPLNRPKLCDVPNLRSTLFFLSEEHMKPKIRAKAGQLLTEIEPETEEDEQKLSISDDDSSSHVTDMTVSSRFVPKQLHVCTIRIGNIRTLAQREKFQKEAVKFGNSVVSATLGSQLQRATIYSTEPDVKDGLIKYLNGKGYEIIAEKEDNFIFGENHALEKQRPAYLDARKSRGSVHHRSHSSPRYSLGQWRPNSETETLSSRLAKWKEAKENNKKGSTQAKTLLSQVTSWFW